MHTFEHVQVHVHVKRELTLLLHLDLRFGDVVVLVKASALRQELLDVFRGMQIRETLVRLLVVTSAEGAQPELSHAPVEQRARGDFDLVDAVLNVRHEEEVTSPGKPVVRSEPVHVGQERTRLLTPITMLIQKLSQGDDDIRIPMAQVPDTIDISPTYF